MTMRHQKDNWTPEIILCILALIALFIALTGCSTVKKDGAPLTSLCVLDFEAKRCWFNKSTNEGPTFETMARQHILCVQDPTVPCYYGINSIDLRRIISR